MLKILTLLIVLMTVGCGGSDKVVIPENPTALPPEDMEVGTAGSAPTDATTDANTNASTPPPLPTPQ